MTPTERIPISSQAAWVSRVFTSSQGIRGTPLGPRMARGSRSHADRRLSSHAPTARRIEIAHRCYSFVDVDPISEIVDLARGRRWSLGVGAGIWDSSGKRLAFYRRYRDRDLRIIDPDGSHPTVVATSAEFEGWSPVGRRFLLEGQSEIQLARDDGRAIPWHFAAGFDAYWSPNGREIIYLQRQRVPCGQVLMIKNVRGGEARPLARCG